MYIKHTVLGQEVRIACRLERWTREGKVASSNPSRSCRRIFFSRPNFVCWLLFGVCSTPLLLQWHIKDPSHSAKSAGVFKWLTRLATCALVSLILTRSYLLGAGRGGVRCQRVDNPVSEFVTAVLAALEPALTQCDVSSPRTLIISKKWWTTLIHLVLRLGWKPVISNWSLPYWSGLYNTF